MKQEILEKAGLSKNESKVYLALISLGSCLAGGIAKKIGLNRTSVYDALDRLIEKGLVSFVLKENRKYFEAAPPEKITQAIKEKQQELEEKKKNVQKILKELRKEYELSKSKSEASIYKGKEGLKVIFSDILREGKTLYVIGATGTLAEPLQFFLPGWEKKRAKAKIDMKILYSEKMRGKRNLKLAEIKYLPKEYSFPVSVGIYVDKVIEIIWTEPPLIILIKSKEAAQGFMDYFKLLWKVAEK